MKKAKNIDDFISGYSKEVHVILNKLRTIVKKVAPETEEAIAYGIPTFRMNDKNLVHFSAFAHHIGFYPTPSAITAFKKELSAYKGAKGSVQFPIDNVPFALVKKMVLFRVKELKKKR